MEDKSLQIRFISVFVNEAFFHPVKKGMQDAAAMLGVSASFVGDPGCDAEVINRMIRTSVDEGVDGLAVNIAFPDANNAAIHYALSCGVPVVAFNMDATKGRGPHLASTVQHFYAAGQSMGQAISEKIPPHAHVLITKHDSGVSALDERASGIIEALRDRHLAFDELITTSESEEAAVRIAAYLRQHPEVEVVLATGQADTEGAGIAVRSQGMDILIGGFDLSPVILQFIQEGHIYCTIDQQPYAQGFYPVLQLTHRLRYGLVPCNIDAGASLVTKDNAGQIKFLSVNHFR